MALASHMWICMRCACYIKGSPSSIRLDTEEHMCDSNAQQTIQNITECIMSLNTIAQNVNLFERNSSKPKLSVSPMQIRRSSKGTPSKSPDSVKATTKVAIESPVNVRDNIKKPSGNGNIPTPPPPPPPPPPQHTPAVVKLVRKAANRNKCCKKINECDHAWVVENRKRKAQFKDNDASKRFREK